MSTDRLAAVRAALEPYPWRRFTREMLLRRVLGAVDRASGRGTASPVARDDRRVEELARFLATHQWRALTVSELCQRLLDALDDWEARDCCIDLELAWLLEEGA